MTANGYLCPCWPSFSDGEGVVRAKSIILPKRQNRILPPLIFLDFSGSSRAVRHTSQVFRILL
jgi:hypothetical protein